MTAVTLADLLEQLGGIAPARVRFRPMPGAATEEDMLAIHDREGRLYELVDGVLVEKAMGLRESYLAIVLSTILWNFVQLRNLGLVTGSRRKITFPNLRDCCTILGERSPCFAWEYLGALGSSILWTGSTTPVCRTPRS